MFDDIDKIKRAHDTQDAENTSTLPSSDEALLRTVDRVLAGASLSSPQLADHHTPESFVALIAGSRAQASEPFKADLLARLQDELPGVVQIEAVSASSAAEDPATKDTAEEALPIPSPAPERRRAQPRQRPIPLPIPVLTRGIGHGKWQRLVLGALGVAAILVMLFGLALVLKVRKDVTTSANATPTAPAISGVGTPSTGGGIPVGPPVQVTPVDTKSLIPRLQKLYTLPQNYDHLSSQTFLATHDPDIWWAWSPDGEMLATQSNGLVQVWDMATGVLKYYTFIEHWHYTWTYTLTWSPDGRTLAVGSDNGAVRLYSASVGAKLLTLSPQPGQGSADSGGSTDWYKLGGNGPSSHAPGTAWSPDGKLLASVQQEYDTSAEATKEDWEVFHSTIYVWDVTTGTIVHRFAISDDNFKDIFGSQGAPSPIVQVAWSPDGKMLAALFESHVVGVWDVASETRFQTLYDHGIDRELYNTLSLIQWLPDSHTIAQAQTDYSELWDVGTGKPRAIPNPPPPTPLEMADVPTIDPKIAPFAPSPTPWPTYVLDNQQYQSVDALALSPSGNEVATHDGNSPMYDGNYLRLWDMASGKQTYKLKVNAKQESFGYGFTLYPLAWSPDGTVLAYSGDGIKLMDTTANSDLLTLTVDGPISAKWSPDGSLLAILASDGLEVWGDPAAHSIMPTPTSLPPLPSPQSVCGQWSIVDAPSVDTYNDLRGVAAIGDNDVWAVGSHRVGSAVQVDGTPVPDIAGSLILHWDGKSWQSVDAPRAGNANNHLMGVAGVASNDVWAVGYFGDTYAGDDGGAPPGEIGAAHSLILHWDGKTWLAISSPQVGKNGNSNRLLAVAAIAADDVWAVGYGDPYDIQGITPTSTAPIILHWDRKSWSQVPSPAPGLVSNELHSISAPSKDAIWAVGTYSSDGDDPMRDYTMYTRVQLLMLFWDGKNWNWVPTPNISSASAFTNISALSKDSAWIVGSNSVLHLDGKNWSGSALPAPPPSLQADLQAVIQGWSQPNASSAPMPTPEAETADQNLAAVLALKPDDMWAIGSLTGYPPRTLAIHWDGAQWSYMPTPSLGPLDKSAVNSLAALVASPSGTLWAVGSYTTNRFGSQPLVLRYTGAKCSP